MLKRITKESQNAIILSYVIVKNNRNGPIHIEEPICILIESHYAEWTLTWPSFISSCGGRLRDFVLILTLVLQLCDRCDCNMQYVLLLSGLPQEGSIVLRILAEYI